MEKKLLSDITLINKDKFKVVHNGFDEKLLKFRKESVSPPKVLPKDWLGKYVFCLANIENRKNQIFLLKRLKKWVKNLY